MAEEDQGVFHGPLHSSVAGRTDQLPLHVDSGAYVIPADVISAAGEGNTIAGFKHMKRVFKGTPYNEQARPYGSGNDAYGQSNGPYDAGSGPYGQGIQTRATGGKAHGKTRVPVIVAGGEYILTPDEVREVGEGDLDTGHAVLDAFVKRMRKEHIKTLSKLPGPKTN